MKPSFELRITSVTTVTDIPNTWSDDRYRELLTHLECEDIGEIPPADLRSYVVMTLQDLEPQEAALKLLMFCFGNELTLGKQQHLSEEMCVERCWEEYADIEHHERLFVVQVLFHEAHEDTPLPEINQIEAVLRAANEDAQEWLTEHCSTAPAPFLPERLLVRCLADALPDRAILNRLFEDQIKGAEFSEAVHILWKIQAEAVPAEDEGFAGYKLSLYSPIRWTGDLEGGRVVICEPAMGD